MDIDAIRQIRQLTSELPKLDCRRKCQVYCATTLDMSDAERDLLALRGIHLPPPNTEARYICPALTRDGDCGIHKIRPAICWVWGLIDAPTVRCPWGCLPERWLTMHEATVFLLKTFKAGGHHAYDDIEVDDVVNAPAEVLELLSEDMENLHDPHGEAVAEMVRDYLAGAAPTTRITEPLGLPDLTGVKPGTAGWRRRAHAATLRNRR